MVIKYFLKYIFIFCFSIGYSTRKRIKIVSYKYLIFQSQKEQKEQNVFTLLTYKPISFYLYRYVFTLI